MKWRLFLVAVYVAVLLSSVNVAYKMGALAGIDACIDTFHSLEKEKSI